MTSNKDMTKTFEDAKDILKATKKKLKKDQKLLSEKTNKSEIEAVKYRNDQKDIKESHSTLFNNFLLKKIIEKEISNLDDHWMQTLNSIEDKIKAQENKWEQSTVNQTQKVILESL